MQVLGCPAGSWGGCGWVSFFLFYSFCFFFLSACTATSRMSLACCSSRVERRESCFFSLICLFYSLNCYSHHSQILQVASMESLLRTSETKTREKPPRYLPSSIRLPARTRKQILSTALTQTPCSSIFQLRRRRHQEPPPARARQLLGIIQGPRAQRHHARGRHRGEQLPLRRGRRVRRGKRQSFPGG